MKRRTIPDVYDDKEIELPEIGDLVYDSEGREYRWTSFKEDETCTINKWVLTGYIKRDIQIWEITF